MAIINAGPAERRNDLNLYLTASFFALLHMVILSAKCHANQCETFRRATFSTRAKAQTILNVGLCVPLSYWESLEYAVSSVMPARTPNCSWVRLARNLAAFSRSGIILRVLLILTLTPSLAFLKIHYL